ncbi:MAG: NADH-quinone oxidoreductase subunit L [Candidatus Dormibacteria bacterium]
MNRAEAGTLALLVLGLPLLGSALCGLLGRRLGRGFVNLVGPLAIAASFVATLVILSGVLGAPEHAKATTVTLWNWIDLGSGNLRVGMDVTLDPLSTVMLLVITGIGFLIHVYSVGYMEHDESPWRFFAYMNFFIFAMALLVLAADLAILVIGWAMVALASYLLIGYYYRRPSAVAAARKAFITQVIGDVALVIGAFLLVGHLPGGYSDAGGQHGPLYLPGIFSHSASFAFGGALVTGICILLAIGAFAKSAQFPLHTWLPDAMEGPTPVSALIHAATMVTAGVYLIARFHPLFDRAPVAQGVVACVGIGTSVMAGIIALSQLDIKRVIAYSTMSQIGLMIYAVGIGAYTAGMYHFATHAAFKALLFLAAGNVIHALHDEQDMRLMGGIRRGMRGTALCFLIGSFALAGFPLFAGWFSKEDLLGFGVTNGPGHFALLLYLLGLIVNVLTGIYAFRLYFRVFEGEPETARGWGVHEASPTMFIPVAILAGLAAFMGFFLLWPFPPSVPLLGAVHPFGSFLEPVFGANGSGHVAGEPSGLQAFFGLVLGTLASLAGIGAAYLMWFKRDPDADVVVNRLPRFLPQLSMHKFYFDELYDAALVRPTVGLGRDLNRVVEPEVMDGWVRGVGRFFNGLSDVAREYQTGIVRDYAGYMMLAAAVFVGFFAVLVVR